MALLAAEFQFLPGMQARDELLSCAADMQAAVDTSRRHLAPWDAKQYALKVSLVNLQPGLTHAASCYDASSLPACEPLSCFPRRG